MLLYTYQCVHAWSKRSKQVLFLQTEGKATLQTKIMDVLQTGKDRNCQLTRLFWSLFSFDTKGWAQHTSSMYLTAIGKPTDSNDGRSQRNVSFSPHNQATVFTNASTKWHRRTNNPIIFVNKFKTQGCCWNNGSATSLTTRTANPS